MTASSQADTPAFEHLVADFVGVRPAQLRDGALLSGLLIAAAGAMGVSASVPLVRHLPDDGVAAMLLLDGCHMTAHAFPERGVLLLDVLTLATHDPQKALDVFARRVTAREIRTDRRPRG